MPNDQNRIMTPVESAIHDAIERCESQEPHGSLILVFPSTPQRVIDDLAENISLLIEQEYGILVFTDKED